jgi:hypothetical protein
LSGDKLELKTEAEKLPKDRSTVVGSPQRGLWGFLGKFYEGM